ncbi:MAG: TIGR01459 family HAD-type hydrolase [Rhodobiaceae bacterium]|nr:TIGR01459 family HAD-type hydrolase [Rhodobiaceae bacterium]MCC0040648.1 TIGR01459 family HAD-type hydrolase [Rhodobiaceae bacterium]
MTRIPEGLGELAGGHDLLVCDVWGVVHNGVRAWPMACVALQRFRAGGGTVVLVSNAPRPGSAVARQLAGFSVPADSWDAIVTSGDLARDALRDARAHAVFHLGPPRDLGVVEGLDVALVAPEDADIVLNTGLFDDETETPDDYAGLIGRMRARDLTMICANPDLVVERGERLLYCAGAVAERYEAAGGTVVWAGKPRPPVYRRALDVAAGIRGQEVPASRTLAIGDALRTDIAGGSAAGFATLFIATGIHAADALSDGAPDMDGIARLADAAGVRPDYVLDLLRWE